MDALQTCWVDDQFSYDGSQLHSLFGYLEYGIQGDSLVSWRGPCDIPFEHMVDGEDKVENEEIRGSDMVHFIFEVFGRDLHFAVAFQRLFAATVKDTLLSMSGNQEVALQLHREGDDIYCGEKKLSISIATVSPVSAMIHFAVNVSNEGTPVKTISLEDLQVEPADFAKECSQLIAQEFQSLVQATKKVHWVK